jgi:hypothetical protein
MVINLETVNHESKSQWAGDTITPKIGVVQYGRYKGYSYKIILIDHNTVASEFRHLTQDSVWFKCELGGDPMTVWISEEDLE